MSNNKTFKALVVHETTTVNLKKVLSSAVPATCLKMIY